MLNADPKPLAWYCPDICRTCDGTGEHGWLSGAHCYECGGLGLVDDDSDEGFLDEDEGGPDAG